jgi:DnaJ domain
VIPTPPPHPRCNVRLRQHQEGTFCFSRPICTDGCNDPFEAARNSLVEREKRMVFIIKIAMFTGNYYAVLKVPENGDPAAIRHAFGVLARSYHPDAGSGSSAQRFRDVAEAYGVLSDPQRRREHDLDLARSPDAV